MTYKEQGGTESHCPKHEKETIAYASHVPKEERGLHEARHIRSCIVVVQAICIDKQPSRSTTEKRPVRIRISSVQKGGKADSHVKLSS